MFTLLELADMLNATQSTGVVWGMSTLFRCYARPLEFVSALKDAILTVWKDVLQRHAWKMMQIAPKKVVFRAPFKTSKTLS